MPALPRPGHDPPVRVACLQKKSPLSLPLERIRLTISLIPGLKAEGFFGGELKFTWWSVPALQQAWQRALLHAYRPSYVS
jgi:hypothetical protein